MDYKFGWLLNEYLFNSTRFIDVEEIGFRVVGWSLETEREREMKLLAPCESSKCQCLKIAQLVFVWRVMIRACEVVIYKIIGSSTIGHQSDDCGWQSLVKCFYTLFMCNFPIGCHTLWYPPACTVNWSDPVPQINANNLHVKSWSLECHPIEIASDICVCTPKFTK